MEILKLKSIIAEIKNSLHVFNNRSGLAEKNISELEVYQYNLYKMKNREKRIGGK